MSSPSSGGTSAIVTPLTGAATRQAKSDASNSVMARVPLQPRLTACQNRSRPAPNGDTTPMPEMTMREPAARMRTIVAPKMLARAVVWLGGALFVAALALCAWTYLFRLGRSSAAGGVPALAADVALFTIFALHHSVFARDFAK